MKSSHKYAIVGLIIVFICILAMGKLHYYNSDDYMFSVIMSGAEGNEYREYVAFENPIWAKAISCMYQLVQQVNWYVVVSLILSMASYVLMAYILVKDVDSTRHGIILWIMLFAFILPYYFIEFNFTYNAYLYCCAGLLSWKNMFNTKVSRSSVICFACGSILIIIGSLIRIVCLYAILPIFGIYILAETTFAVKNIKDLAKEIFIWLKNIGK